MVGGWTREPPGWTHPPLGAGAPEKIVWGNVDAGRPLAPRLVEGGDCPLNGSQAGGWFVFHWSMGRERAAGGWTEDRGPRTEGAGVRLLAKGLTASPCFPLRPLPTGVCPTGTRRGSWPPLNLQRQWVLGVGRGCLGLARFKVPTRILHSPVVQRPGPLHVGVGPQPLGLDLPPLGVVHAERVRILMGAGGGVGFGYGYPRGSEGAVSPVTPRGTATEATPKAPTPWAPARVCGSNQGREWAQGVDNAETLHTGSL